MNEVLPACRERTVNFALPPIESAADIAAAMKAVTSALADGAITPGEAATIAAVVDTFVRAIETSDFNRRLQLMEDDFVNRARTEASAGPRMRFNFSEEGAADLLQVQQPVVSDANDPVAGRAQREQAGAGGGVEDRAGVDM